MPISVEIMKLAEYHKEEVLRLIELDPNMQYSDIGKEIGISKERVRQILKKNNKFVPRHGVAATTITKNCSVCGKVMTLTGTKGQLAKKTCSDKCAKFRPKTAERITLVCCRCGKTFTRKKSWARAKKHYCNRECYLNWQKEKV